MPLDAEKLDELKSNIALARRRPLAFGLCLGTSPETTVLLNHKTKDPETVGRMAKKEGETNKLAFGTMMVEGKNLDLSCHGDVLPGLARKAKEMLKAAGIKLKVRILDAAGNVLEEHGDPEDEGAEEGGAAPAPGGAPGGAAEAADPNKDKWAEVKPRVEEALGKAGTGGKTDLTQALATWQGAVAKAESGDFAAALAAAGEAVKQIGAAVGAARIVEADRARWQAAAAALGPVIEGLAKEALPEVKKINALWSVAQSKAAGAMPDFGTALKSVPMIEKLVAEVREKLGGGTGGGAPAAPPPPATDNKAAPPVNAEENARLAAMTPEELAKTDLTVGDTTELFSEDYMLKLKDAPIKGEDDPDLKKLMDEIAKSDLTGPRRGEVMVALAKIVGEPPTADQLDADYGRFLIVRKQQEAIGKQKQKEEVPALDENKHPDFMGSRSQLMFGKVLGDAFGIHEVFASLLSPTGGLVGAGNDSVQLDPDNPVAIHGTVHDAAGYLKSYHDEGPGYNYRESDIEKIIFDNLPIPDYLGGQLSGVAYWVKEAGPDYIEKRVTDLVMAVDEKLGEAREVVEEAIDAAIEEGKQKIEEGIDLAKEIAAAAEKEVLEIKDAVVDAGVKVKDAVVETAGVVKDAVVETGVAVKDAVVETGVAVKDAVVDTASAVGEAVGEVTDAAAEKLQAAWDWIWD